MDGIDGLLWQIVGLACLERPDRQFGMGAGMKADGSQCGKPVSWVR